MKRVEMADATAPLQDYARGVSREPLVVMRRGKPVAALIPLDEGKWEDMVVSTHPGFIDLIERSRARQKPGHGIPLEEIKRKYGIRTRPARKRSRRDGNQ